MACTGQILIHVVTHEAHPLSAKSHDTKMQKKMQRHFTLFLVFSRSVSIRQGITPLNMKTTPSYVHVYEILQY